jgi:hypothetical protein
MEVNNTTAEALMASREGRVKSFESVDNLFEDLDKGEAKVFLSYDGWTVEVNDKTYGWDHNDEDMGTEALVKLLSDLGFDTTLEEVY